MLKSRKLFMYTYAHTYTTMSYIKKNDKKTRYAMQYNGHVRTQEDCEVVANSYQSGVRTQAMQHPCRHGMCTNTEPQMCSLP
jgi:hypothetical protein